MRRPERPTSRRAFTLIELLVVLAIIALLVSLLLPAIARVRRAARSTVCLGRVSQIGQALVMYADMYKGWIPREGTEGLTTATLRARLPWPVALRPFLDPAISADAEPNDKFVSAPYYRCPSRGDRHPIQYVSNGFRFTAPGVAPATGGSGETGRRGPTHMHKHLRPATTIYLAEMADDPNEALLSQWMAYGPTDLSLAQFYDIWAVEQITEGHPNIRIHPRRHEGGASTLFLDGHATHEKAKFLTTLANWDDGIYR